VEGASGEIRGTLDRGEWGSGWRQVSVSLRPEHEAVNRIKSALEQD
jgi:hypothetical protein